MRAEFAASSDRLQRAILQYEIASLLEVGFRNEAAAVQEYLGSYNLYPTFRPPLFALIRIFEDKRSYGNLVRLYDAEARSAPTPSDRAWAWVDRGVLLEESFRENTDALGAYENAIEADPGAVVAALMLEFHAFEAGDWDAVLRAVELRTQLLGPTLESGLLRLELANAREARGDIDGAFVLWRQAASLPEGRWRFLQNYERAARRHGRLADLSQALDARAALAWAQSKGEELGQSSGAFSLRGRLESGRARAEAAFLWFEAARLHRLAQGDRSGALGALRLAFETGVDGELVLQECAITSELDGDIPAAQRYAQARLERSQSAAARSALRFWQGWIEQGLGRPDDAAGEYAKALQESSECSIASMALEDLALQTGRFEERLQLLLHRARRNRAPERSMLLWEAAQFTAHVLDDVVSAHSLYREAIEAAADKGPILREHYGLALGAGEHESLRESAQALLAAGVDAEERSAILHDLFDVYSSSLGYESQALKVLQGALEHPATQHWAPRITAVEAARRGDLRLLARAHRALALQTEDKGLAAAHLCAAARAAIEQKDDEGARELLRKALEWVPGHRYALTLLTELLRSKGEADEVVALLHHAAASQEESRSAERSLMLAGVAAELAGDPALALRSYEEAAGRNPSSTAALWAQRRVAKQRSEAELLLRADRAILERDAASWESGFANFELAEHLDLALEKPKWAAKAYVQATESKDYAAAAALGSLLLSERDVDFESRRKALERLLEEANNPDRGWIWRELGAAAFCQFRDVAFVQRASDEVIALRRSDRWARLARLLTAHSQGGSPGARAQAWLELGRLTPDTAASAELVLHGLRAQMTELGTDALEDACILAHSIATSAPDEAAAAVALDETMGAADDPETRADALGRRVQHADPKGHFALEAAHGRALVAAERYDDAYRVLKGVVSREVDDLASWEALRLAARATRQWQDVVLACDELANKVEGPLRAQLLEEGAAVWMDQLGRDDEAEVRLQAALALDIRRTVAAERLRDLLVDRGDSRGLLDLISRRVQVVDDRAELIKLYYEQARLLRGEGELEAALDAVQRLLTLDPQHVAALALGVEIYVASELWSEAVEALLQLSMADVPVAQKRLARLGAANFLDEKLARPDEAYRVLKESEKLGELDPDLCARLADFAERAARPAQAVEALQDAIARSEGEARATFERRLGLLLQRSGDLEDAKRVLQQAFALLRTDLECATALAELATSPRERKLVIDDFEASLYTQIALDPTDAKTLHKLERVAEWESRSPMLYRVQSALALIEGGTPSDPASFEDTSQMRLARTLEEEVVDVLRAVGDQGPGGEICRLAFETLIECERLRPGDRGLGRGDLIPAKRAYDVRDEIFELASTFLPGESEFYLDRDEEWSIRLLVGKRGRPAWFVGESVACPLSPLQRFQVGRLAFALREQTLPFVQRRPYEGANLLFALAAAAGSPIAGHAQGAPGIPPLRQLQKVMSRKCRKGIQQVVAAMEDDGENFEAWCTAVRRSAMRAGMVVSGNLRSAIEYASGRVPSLEAIRASEDAKDLLRFWLSQASIDIVQRPSGRP